MEFPREAHRGRIHRVAIGIQPEVTVGGDAALPFEGLVPAARPALALELSLDTEDWPAHLLSRIGDTEDLNLWARAAREQGADVLCLRLNARDDSAESESPVSDYARLCCMAVDNVLSAGLPLIIVGSGNRDEDDAALPLIAEQYSGRRLALGSATEDNYRQIAEACRQHGHVLIAESPIDINICKQLNILVTDAGLPIDQILIDPTTGGLGYGIEYTYSIMERARLAALHGDRMLACPQICFVGAENWKLKEASTADTTLLGWGDPSHRGTAWEAVAATALIMAGAHLVVLRDPAALQMTRANLDAIISRPE